MKSTQFPTSVQFLTMSQESALARAKSRAINYVKAVRKSIAKESHYVPEAYGYKYENLLIAPNGAEYASGLPTFYKDILVIEMLFEQFHILMTTKPEYGTGLKAKRALAEDIFHFVDNGCFISFVDGLPFKESLKGLHFAYSLLRIGFRDFNKVESKYKEAIELFG